jgi:hypothetical protein
MAVDYGCRQKTGRAGAGERWLSGEIAARGSRFAIRDSLEPGTWNLEPGTWKLETGNWKLETGNWKLETGNWKLETGNWKLETGNWKLEAILSASRSTV